LVYDAQKSWSPDASTPIRKSWTFKTIPAYKGGQGTISNL
jgi:hypothetical protein